jgi:Zn-dependent alcohol dehydrogenase
MTELNFASTPQTPVFTSKNGKLNDIHGAFFGQSSFANLSIVRQCSVVNAKDLVKDKKELQLFAPLGCGIQTGSGTVINAAKAGPNDIVCILGLGGVGLSAIMAAKIQGCRGIIGVDRVRSRLALAKELGATNLIDGSNLPSGKSLTDTIRDMAEGLGPSVVIDTTGVPALIQAGLESARQMGRVVQVGSAPFEFNLEINVFSYMMRGVQYLGAIEGQAYPPEFVPKMVQWYREGKFPIDKLVKFMPAEEFEKALEEMHSGTTIKPILTW